MNLEMSKRPTFCNGESTLHLVPVNISNIRYIRSRSLQLTCWHIKCGRINIQKAPETKQDHRLSNRERNFPLTAPQKSGPVDKHAPILQTLARPQLILNDQTEWMSLHHD